jgi:ArsR family transcriptional regulator, arsenate/arsenite/antimonite-responsive transcriptional repressor
LASQSACVSGDLSAELPLSRTTVFQHLTMLREAGWVKGTIVGARINYCLDWEVMQKDIQSLGAFLKIKSSCKECV